MSINESSMWAAVHRMESASEQMARAAEEITQAVQRFAFLLEPGYGGNGLRLIELLEQTATQPEQSGHVSVPREWLDAVKELFDAKQAKEDFERENPGNSTKRWDACLYRIEAADDALRALLNGGEA